MGHHGSLGNYVSLLKRNHRFRALFIGEIINSCGNWFTFVAMLSLVNSLSDGSSIYISLVLLVRLLPGTLLFPITGAVADMYDRASTMRKTCYFEAMVVGACMLITKSAQLPLLFLLNLLQFSSQAFYEPARRAMQPIIVDQQDLDLATTLDTFSWSLMGAIGASVGGWVTSALGTSFCFFVDAISYIISAQIATRLLGIPLVKQAKQTQSQGSEQKKTVTLLTAIKDSLKNMTEGWKYITTAGNWDVGVLCLIKASGALLWGVADVMNVKVSEQVKMQQLGDANSTLGFIFACVGLGCLLGPLIFNRLLVPSPRNWLRGCLIAMALQSFGYVFITMSDTIYLALLGTLVRSMGSATLWVYSTLVLQWRAQEDMLGRLFALELAGCTLCEGATVVLAGLMFDWGHVSVKMASIIVGTAGVFVTLAWLQFVQTYSKQLDDGQLAHACCEGTIG